MSLVSRFLAVAALALASARGASRRRCASASPRTPTSSIRRSRARSSAASCSRRCATSCSTSTRSSRSCRSSPTGYEWSADSKALTIKLRPGVTSTTARSSTPRRSSSTSSATRRCRARNRRGELRAGRERRRRRSDDRAAQPVGAVLAAARAARRPRRHDGVAEGRDRPRATSSAPSRCARARSSSSSASRRTASCSSAIRTTGTRARVHFDTDRLPADRRLDGAPREPQVRPARLHRAHGAVRRRRAEERQPLQDRARSPRSATRASRSTSARATWRRRTRSARTPRVREAFELALDRDGIVQVVMDGEATVGNQWVAPTNAVLREERAGAQARRRAREGAARRRPACRTRASR